MSGSISSFITHTLAFLFGAGVIFTLLALAMSQSFDVHTAHGDATCFITDIHPPR
jgi:hypothetical protein